MKVTKSISFLLLCLIFISSCAGLKKRHAQDNINDLQDEFDWLDNSDFQKVFEVKYRTAGDTYPEEIAKVDALSNESIARIPEGKLSDVSDSDNVISRVTGTCYKKNFKDAKQLIRESRKKYKLNPSFWNQVGTCYFLQGEKRKALIFYNKAIALKKNYAPAVNNMGVLLQSEGYDQRALAAYNEAMRISSFSLTPNFNKAQIYLKYGFIHKAEKIFSTLWRKNKRDRDVVHALAVIYMQQNQYTKSINAFETLDSDSRELPEIALNYALVLALAGNKDKANSVLEDLSERDINRFAGYYNKVKRMVRK